MLKLLLPLFVYADSGQQIQSSTPSPSECFFFQISLKLCDFFMFLSGFSRSRNSFSRSPTFNKHVRFTSIYIVCIVRATATPPFRIPFPRPWPSFSTASTSFPSSFHLPILAIRNFLPRKKTLPEATTISGRGLHRSAGRQQPLDHGVVAILRCKEQRGVASERPQRWLTQKVQ